MYRVYLRKHDQTVEDMFRTENPDEAQQRFADMVNSNHYNGLKMGVVLSYNSQEIAFHRFDRYPGQADYWRDNLDSIEMPVPEDIDVEVLKRRAGRPVVYGAVRKNISISPEHWEKARRIGNGNASAGFARAVDEFEE